MQQIFLIILTVLSIIFIAWVSVFFIGAPFQPSSDRETEEIIKLSGTGKRKAGKRLKVADIGSGDGKIVIAFAKRGAEAHGFEINPLLVWLSRRRIRKLKLQDRAFIHRKNFWNQDFSKFDIVTSFQISYIMPGLEKKLKKELRKGAFVISNTWKFPHWKPKKQIEKVYLYVKKDN